MGLTTLAKLVRFTSIYGPGRTWFKAAGRLRVGVPPLSIAGAKRDIGIVGCGQFAFATIGYFLQRRFGARIAACYDTDSAARDSLARALRVPRACPNVSELFATPGLRTVYIASNHASHAAYAARSLALGIDTYVEKPIAVDHAQLAMLLKAALSSQARVFAGYNRPFSAAVRRLRTEMPIEPAGGLTMQCFVSGHRLGPDHWYRRPEEGTRVCGNIGHWLDLMVHVLSWRGLPDQLRIAVAWADDSEPDDNCNVTITTDRGDLFSVMLTSRNEPFEGINETIHIQHGETTCKIDDFRRMTVWQGTRLRRWRFWPKDVGHRLAVLQPFGGVPARDWHEVELSTLLMLHIADMVRAGERESAFSFKESWDRLCRDMQSQ